MVENSPHIMKYWRDHASDPIKSHDLWFITEDMRWGKFEPTFDAKALIDKECHDLSERPLSGTAASLVNGRDGR